MYTIIITSNKGTFTFAFNFVLSTSKGYKVVSVCVCLCWVLHLRVLCMCTCVRICIIWYCTAVMDYNSMYCPCVKPLVLDQDCMTLCSRDLRLEKRTLFRYTPVYLFLSLSIHTFIYHFCQSLCIHLFLYFFLNLTEVIHYQSHQDSVLKKFIFFNFSLFLHLSLIDWIWCP